MRTTSASWTPRPSAKSSSLTTRTRNSATTLVSGSPTVPTLTQNIVINAGFGAFLPGKGYRDIYRGITQPVPGFSAEPAGHIDRFLYSGIVAVTFTY